MANESSDQQDTAATDDQRRLAVWEKAIVWLCVVGVIATLGWALNSSDIPLFDGHAAEVLSHFWTRTATVGLIAALVIASLVGIFVWVLAKSTLLSEDDPDIPVA